MDRLYTCAEIAERYGVKTLTVWDWIRKGRLNAIRPGKQYLVYESELTALERRGQEGA